jgi:hypothetical protein
MMFADLRKNAVERRMAGLRGARTQRQKNSNDPKNYAVPHGRFLPPPK